jgi:DNA polymerase-3 subunit gamma/tau
MSSQTLYRKYRPKNFSEIIGQHHIVQTLSNAIKNNHLGQAYLFTGPRGTGKTSIARILAKTINCTELKEAITCEKCPACETISAGRSLDIIEIDAASNTGVDNIRELRETINLPPTSLKYKVYIIDEVHMLSTGAFNALLKTLEEPPAHVVFILATTEIHKVPETILSRCQRFDFTRLPIQNIIEKLSLIAKEEEITIDTDSLEMIAIAAEGGMRDAESLFGQIISLEDKNITVKEVQEILGTTDRNFSFELVDLLAENDSTKAIQKINSLIADGYDLQVFNKSLINYLRQLMLLKINPELKSSFSYEMTTEQLEKTLKQCEKIELEKILNLITLFLEAQNKISASILPQLPLEIAIIKATQKFPETQVTKSQEPVYTNSKPTQSTPAAKIISNSESQAPQKIETQAVPEETFSANTKLTIDDVRINWNKLLEQIKPVNHSLQALLFSCQIFEVSNGQATFATPYDFYKEKLNDPKNRLTVETVLGKILESKILIKTVTNKEVGIENKPARQRDATQDAEGQQDSLLASAMEIMGGSVITE